MFHPNATNPTSETGFFSSVPVRAHHHLVHPSWSHGTSHLGVHTLHNDSLLVKLTLNRQKNHIKVPHRV